VGSG